MIRYYSILLLSILTGIIHLFLGIIQLDTLLGISLLLNGLGYFFFVAIIIYANYRDYDGNAQWLGLLIYAVITIIAYFATWLPQIGAEAFTEPVGMFTKLVELAIAILGGLEYRQEMI